MNSAYSSMTVPSPVVYSTVNHFPASSAPRPGVHGEGLSQKDYTEERERLERRYRIVAVDWPTDDPFDTEVPNG